MKIVNAHTHICYREGIDEIEKEFRGIMECFGYEKLHFLSIPHHFGTDMAQNLKCLYLKEKLGGYASAGLCHGISDTREDFLSQAKLYRAMGFDGYKMLEGKPNLRKEIGIPLDSRHYWLFYEYAEENEIPIVMHAADPDKFWDLSTATEYQKQQGWVYDETYPSKQEILKEVWGIMENFPHLKLTLAHMGFMQQEKEKIQEFLERWDNTALDLVISNDNKNIIAEDISWWTPFLQKHKTRFIYGTDLYPFDKKEKSYEEVFPRDVSLKAFLEGSEAEINLGNTSLLRGLSLEEDMLERFYYENHNARYGKSRKADAELALKMCDGLTEEKYEADVKIIRSFFQNL